MQAKKLIALVFSLAITASLIVSCAAPPEVTVKVKIVDYSSGTADVLRDGEITFQGSDPSVFDALEAYCTEYNVPLDAEDSGYINSLDGIGGDSVPVETEDDAATEDEAAATEATEGTEATEAEKEFVWIFLLNDVEPQEGGAKMHKVMTGDTIEYRYIEYVPEATK